MRVRICVIIARRFLPIKRSSQIRRRSRKSFIRNFALFFDLSAASTSAAWLRVSFTDHWGITPACTAITLNALRR
jgi:hypothetical protein